MELLAFHLHRLGAERAEVVTFVADGAPWVWERLDWVQGRVGLAAGRVRRVLDWCHAVHNVSLALEALSLSEEERRRLYRKLRRWLRRGWPGLVVRELEALGKARGWPEALEQPLGYLRKHMEAGHLAYGAFRRQGLPLGSGMVESACKWLIQQRFKGVGMRWSEDGFNHLLHLRLAWINGRWEALFDLALSPNS